MQNYTREFGTSDGAQDILDGQFDQNNFNHLPAVNYLIKHNLCRVAAANSVNIKLLVKELKGRLKKQNETTSSSPSGRQ
eukprot:377912-Ditylum_brightwellii.AAC.1